MEKPVAEDRIAYSVAGGARACSVSKSFMYKLIKEGQIEAVKAGTRTLIPRASIERWLARNSNQAA